MSVEPITITLVRVTIGGVARLHGRTASDRWNLLQFGISSLAASRNQSELKALRRKLGTDFILTVSRSTQGVVEPTRDELALLGSASCYVVLQALPVLPSIAV